MVLPSRAALLGIVMVCACRSRDAQIATAVHDSSGVSIVENRASDRPLPWTLKAIATLDSSTGSQVQFSELTEYTVDADTLGHIYVIDFWYGQKVQLLDTAGQLIRLLTRSGGGPGEVGKGGSISVSPDGILGVMDFTKTAIVRVRWDGTVLPTLPLPGYEPFGAARVANDTFVVHTLDLHDPSGSETLKYRAGDDTATLAVHTPVRLGRITFCGDGVEGLTPMLAPELRWTAQGARVALHHTADYEIDEFHGPHLVRRVRRNVGSGSGSVASVGRFFPDGKAIGSPECVVSPAELVAKRGVTRRIQPIRRLAIDPSGQIWAERNTFPDERPRVDLFDKSGTYLGTLHGFGAPLGFPSRDLLVFAFVDSVQGEPTLGIFRRIR